MGWITALKRPAMTVRWGMAVEYVAPRGYNGSVYPIGTTQNLSVKGAPGGPAGGGAPPMGMPDGGMGGGQGNPQLQQLTGELGQKVVAQLQERMARGDFGQVMASLGKAPAGAAAWARRHGSRRHGSRRHGSRRHGSRRGHAGLQRLRGAGATWAAPERLRVFLVRVPVGSAPPASRRAPSRPPPFRCRRGSSC